MIKLLPAMKDDSIKVQFLQRIGTAKMDIAQQTGNWPDPIQWVHKALDLAIKINYKSGIPMCYWAFGICLAKSGNYPDAMKYLKEGSKNAVLNNNPRQVINCNIQIADCYMNLGRYEDAINLSQEIIESSHQPDLQAWADNNAIEEWCVLRIGGANEKLQNYQEALKWYDRVLKKHRAIGVKQINLAIASVQMEMGNYDEALKNYLNALPLLVAEERQKGNTDLEFKGILGGYYTQIGEIYYKIGILKGDSSSTHNYHEAINYLNKSIPLLEKGAGGRESLMNTYDLLRKACEAVNDYQNALHFTTLYSAIRDSIYNKKTFNDIADQRIKFETEKAAAELKGKEELEKARNEKLTADEKAKQDKLLADERLKHAQDVSEQKIAATTAASEKLIAEEKAKQEKLKSDKQRQFSNLLIAGLALVLLSSVFLFLYLRQRQLKRRAIERAESVHKMAELEMQGLRAQLNPHFMFNSLNSIQSLILKEDSDKSQSYLARFARLLRMVLDNADVPFIPLAKEIEFLGLYMSLESLRVPDLQYSISTDPELNTEQTMVPTMFLQPYVENAIWHGLSHKEDDKQLDVRIYRENGTMNYEIQDNGVGRTKAEELKSLFRRNHQSKGMELLNKRIKLLNKEYRSTIRTEINDVIKNNRVAGTLVTIKVPAQISGQL